MHINDKHNISEGVPKAIKVHSVVQAEASINDFNLIESTPIKATEIPPLTKTRSGKTDLGEEKDKQVVIPNYNKTLSDSKDHDLYSFTKLNQNAKASTPNEDICVQNYINDIEPETLCKNLTGNSIFCSPSKLNIQIDDDISFSIESPTLDCTTNKET